MSEQADPHAYYQRIEVALGTRDPLEVLAQTAGLLHTIAEGTPAHLLRTRPFQNKWTPNEFLGHLVDAEIMFGVRLRLVLCEPGATFPGWDQERWVLTQQHNTPPPQEHAKQFTAIRSVNLPVWRSLSPAQLDLHGVHASRGRESLGLMLRITAGHDLLHLDQLRRYLDAVSQRAI